MHKPLFRIAVGSVAAVGGLIVASALPAGAATVGRAETMAFTAASATSAGTPTQPPSPFPTLAPCTPGTAPNSDCADTPVTFTVSSSGVLAITAPTTLVDLGSSVSSTHNVGTTIGTTGNFGAVTVVDNRGLNPAGWIASVSSTDFVNASTGLPADTIPAADATYAIPSITAAASLPLSGSGASGTLTNNATTTGKPLANTPTAVVTVAAFDGDNAATWTPTIDIAVPGNAVVGTYDAWVTHSVT